MERVFIGLAGLVVVLLLTGVIYQFSRACAPTTAPAWVGASRAPNRARASRSSKSFILC